MDFKNINTLLYYYLKKAGNKPSKNAVIKK